MPSFDFHVYHHYPNDQGPAILHAIAALRIELKGLIMATAQEFQAGFDRVNAATNAIAQLIRDLVAAQAAGGMSADEEDAARNQLLAAADALEAMAVTPTNPVPVPVPQT